MAKDEGPAKRVLLVEDDRRDAVWVSEALKQVWSPAPEIVHAAGLSTARRKASQPGLLCALVDLGLPDAHGLDAVTELSAWAPELPIVVLTATADSDLVDLALMSGAQEYLVKGHVDAHALVHAIRHAVERKQAERDLQVSERRFRSLIENASDAVLIVDYDAQVGYASPSATRIFGYAPHELVGLNSFDLVHPDDLQMAATTFLAVRSRAGVHRPVRVRAIRRDGAHRVLEVTATNLLDEPAVAGIVVNGRDVTEETRVENALRESEWRLNVLTEHTSDIITILDQFGNVMFTSASIAHVLGPRGKGRSPLDLIHPDDLERLVHSFRSQGAPGATSPVEFRMAHADGTWRDVEGIVNNLLGERGIESMVVTIRDITERKRAERRLAGQREILEMTARGAPLEETLEALAHVVERLVHGTICSVLLLAEDGTHLALGAAPSLPEEWRRGLANVAVDPEARRPSALSALRNAQVACEDIFADPEWEAAWPAARSLGLRGFQSEPIRSSKDGGLLGTLSLYFRDDHVQSPDDQRVVDTAVNLAAIAIEKHRAEERLAHQALHDPLTGLPNRVLFIDRMSQAIARSEGGVALVYVDLDHFKVVNESLGHDAGDRLLVAVGERLASALGRGHTVARFGGDEFAVLLEEALNQGDAVAVTERVFAALTAAFDIGGREVFVTASAGITFSGEDGELPERLLQDADAALHTAKQRGRARWEVFDREMRGEILHQFETATALRRALERGELLTYFQPVVEIATGDVIGLEALVRWDHPDQGILPPVRFIPTAEATGLIVPLGAFVLEDACRHLARWQREAGSGLRLNVNLSARQLVEPDFPQFVARVLEQTGLDPAALCLEITESVLMDDEASSVAMIKSLKDLGVLFGIDDFGTGYSSLTYVKRFPVDVVKIDKSFVHGLADNPLDAAIVGAVLSLARDLGLSVVAEGVETADQLARLRELGCERAQGYYFAKPMPPAEIDALLRSGRVS